MRSSRSGRPLVFVLAFASAIACSDDLVEVPAEQPGKLYCMIAAGTMGHFADGTQWTVLNYDEHRNAAGCGCFLQEERWSEETLEKLNDLTLEDCLKTAAQFDFVWDECQQDYWSGAWLNVVWQPEPDSVYWRADLRCADD